jgi:hypothetical protein
VNSNVTMPIKAPALADFDLVRQDPDSANAV